MQPQPSPTTQTNQSLPHEQEQQGVQGWLKVVIAVIFYAGLTGFLLSSIDHVAWFFHLYEPASQPGDGWAMVPSYGKAGALDLAIFFLAYVAATGQAADKVLTWTFTIILSCVSLYANYLYAMFFSPEHQADIWHIQILWGVTTTGWLSPIIASSYPLFAMIFMYLIERVISRRAETPEEMRQRLHALKEKKEIEQQIKAVTKGQVKGAAIEAIDNGLEVFNHVRGRLAKQVQTPVNDSEPAAESTIAEVEQESSSASSTDEQEAIKNTALESEERDHEANHRHTNQGEKAGQESHQGSLSSAMSGRSLVSVEEAARMLLIEPKTVETLRNKGILKAHPGNKDRITIASIRTYDEKRSRKPKAALKAPSSAVIDANQPGLMIVPDEPLETGVDALDITCAALKEHPEITDEELAEKLHLKRPASARFWRLKADEVMKASSSNHQPTPEPIDVEASS
jgi:hypothetical protein